MFPVDMKVVLDPDTANLIRKLPFEQGLVISLVIGCAQDNLHLSLFSDSVTLIVQQKCHLDHQ